MITWQLVAVVLWQLIAVASTVEAVPIPADWQKRVNEAKMIFSASPADPGYAPYVGNGYVAAGLDLDTCYMAGVFNGYRNVTPSHRAAIPSPMRVRIQGPPSTPIGGALDVERAIYFNRSRLHDGSVIEQRWYAHQTKRSVLVYEVGVLEFGSATEVTLQMDATLPLNNTSTNGDFTPSHNVTHQYDNVYVWQGTTREAETAQSTSRTVAMAFQAVPSQVLLTRSLNNTRFLNVFFSDLDSSAPVKDALALLALLASVSSEALVESHEQAWRMLHDEGGIDLVAANVTIASTVNSSLYYLYSSARADWPYGLSPCGLSGPNSCYHSHSFWDTETWMYPNFLLLRPSVSPSLLEYRARRVDEAKERARVRGWEGANWPWESAFTGVDTVVAPNIEGKYEQHISGDIVRAFAQQWYATGDRHWLNHTAWPVIEPTCAFLACRMQRTEPSSVVDADGDGAACGVKTGTGNYTILDVQPPDERAGLVNSSCYTNAVAASALLFCVRAGALLDRPVPAQWTHLARNVYLPLSATLWPGRLVHPEYAGYAGQQINQADVTLLQYPLQWPVQADIAHNDLLYYTAHTDPNGFFTGDSAYSIAWLALGNRTAADTQFANAFAHMDLAHFNVWRERAHTDGKLNFITGAGGYLQNFVYGYAGVRVTADALRVSPTPVLPPQTTRVTLRLSYLTRSIVLTYDTDKCCVALRPPSSHAPSSLLPLRLVQEQSHQSSTISLSPVCFLLPQSFHIEPIA